MSTFQEKLFPLQQVLELACAAQRVNKDYIKGLEAVYEEGCTDFSKVMYYKHSNRSMMEVTLGITKTDPSEDIKMKPAVLCTNLEDRDLANDIQKYYKRLLFAAIDGTNEFQVNLNSILNSTEIAQNKFGFVACLPSVYKRDYARTQTEKRAKEVDLAYLGSIGQNLMDLDCEILSSFRSKNYDAWNIDAIIDNKMVSWMSKVDLKPGNCVVVKAKVKDHGTHWKFAKPVTRLNYVKAAQ